MPHPQRQVVHEDVDPDDDPLGLLPLERLVVPDAGFLPYTVNHGRRLITFAGDVWVEEHRRREGVATALPDELRRRHPGYDIDPGEMTKGGAAWWSTVSQ